MSKQFKNIKVHVPTPEISGIVQRKLFDMGFRWYDSGKVVNEKEGSYLYITPEGNITYRRLESIFTEGSEEQVHYLQILTENLDGTLFKCRDSDTVYYLVGDYAYWVDDWENKVSSVEYSLTKYTTVVDVNEEAIVVKQYNDEMPKLIAGKHAVKTKYGLGIVVYYNNSVAWSYFTPQGGWDDEIDIVEGIYEFPPPYDMFEESSYNESNLIWSKEDDAKKQARRDYEKLQEQIKELQEKASILKETSKL